MSVHAWRGRWLTLCHTCGATTAHTDEASAAAVTCCGGTA